MKTVLIIKTSSMGDVIHTLPALTDAQTALGEIQFDWVVEEPFAEIPAWHPAVRTVIPVALRRWRKQLFKTFIGDFFSPRKNSEWQRFKQQLQQQHYDYIIDAQGLLKSAFVTHFAHGESYGLDKHSAREMLAANFYQHPQAVAKQQHAVERVRQLFAQSLGYSLHDLPLDYGIRDGIRDGIKDGIKDDIKKTIQAVLKATQDETVNSRQETADDCSRVVLFLHATTWETKHWPEQYWLELADQVTAQEYLVLLPWSNEREYQRALKIKQHCQKMQQVVVLKKMDLNELVHKILSVDAIVAVDTGLAHLGAALDKPTIALFGPTSPGLTGTYGQHQVHLQTNYSCAPCFNKQCNKTENNIKPECYTALTPEQVMASLNTILK